MRKELLELGVKLRGQRLVVRDDERGPIQLANDVRNRKRFSRAGYTQQRLVPIAGLDGLDQLRNGLSLVATGRVVRFQLKRHSTKIAFFSAAAGCHEPLECADVLWNEATNVSAHSDKRPQRIQKNCLDLFSRTL